MPTGQASTGSWFGMLVTGAGEWERCEVDGLGPAHGGWLDRGAMREDRMGAMPNVEPFFPCVVVPALGVSGSWRPANGSGSRGGVSGARAVQQMGPEGVSGCKLAQNRMARKL